MDTENFVIEHKASFLSNKGHFNEQPLFVLSPNKALSGDDFIAVNRLRTSTDEGAPGYLNLVVGTTAGMWSVTGSKNINAGFVSNSAGSTGFPLGSTGFGSDYVVTTVMINGSEIQVIVKEDIFFGDIVLTGFDNVKTLNHLINNMRAEKETNPTDGTAGKSLLMYYTFNRQELGSSITTVADRSGNSLTGAIKGTASGDGTTATISGWSYSPNEGGFRLDGGGWIESETANTLNVTQNATSAMTVMTFAKWANTGTSVLMQKVDGAIPDYGIVSIDGLLTMSSNAGSISAAQIESGRWYHLAMSMDGTTGSNSGMVLYINGTSAVTTALTAFTEDVNPRIIFGKNHDLVNSGFTGSVGMTRIWNRRLSDNEVKHNYLSTIPSMMTLESIKIG